MTEKNEADEQNLESRAEDQPNDTEDSSRHDSAGEQEVASEPTIEELQAKVNENWDLYLRAVAELENVRRRSTRDLENAHKFGIERFAREMLAVKDSLEMGIEAGAGDEATLTSLVEGTDMTLKMLIQALEKFGVMEVDPLGEPFDPEFHEALSMQPSPDVEPNSVLNVIQKGYRLHDRLLRPARVIVAKAMEQA